MFDIPIKEMFIALVVIVLAIGISIGFGSTCIISKCSQYEIRIEKKSEVKQ